MSRPYPEQAIAPLDGPPRSFVDGAGREIEIVAADHHVHPSDAALDPDADAPDGLRGEAPRCDTHSTDAFEALVEMYVAFDPADRAQGIPPGREAEIREWLDALLDSGEDTLAYHDGACVGHATLVEDSNGASELAIFVVSAYQHAGIGSVLLEALLGQAQAAGVERVWLTVERWNQAAIALYHKLGFETCNTESFELEMSIRLQ